MGASAKACAHLGYFTSQGVCPRVSLEQANAKLPKDKTIAIYCRSGRRSANSAALLAKEGYKLVNLKGGIIAWTKEEKPVVAD